MKKIKVGEKTMKAIDRISLCCDISDMNPMLNLYEIARLADKIQETDNVILLKKREEKYENTN